MGIKGSYLNRQFKYSHIQHTLVLTASSIKRLKQNWSQNALRTQCQFSLPPFLFSPHAAPPPLLAIQQWIVFSVTYLLFVHKEQDGQGHLSKEDNQQQDKELGQSKEMLTALSPATPPLPLYPGSTKADLCTWAEVPTYSSFHRFFHVLWGISVLFLQPDFKTLEGRSAIFQLFPLLPIAPIEFHSEYGLPFVESVKQFWH